MSPFPEFRLKTIVLPSARFPVRTRNVMRLSAVLWLCACVFSASADTPEQKLMFKRAYDVLEKHCVDCHGPDDQKGDLRVDSLKALLDGGDGGEAIVVGHADQSELLARMRLSKRDEDVMPPRKARRKKPVVPADLLALSQWIDAGAPWFDEIVNGGPVVSPAEVAAMHEGMGVTTAAKPGEISEEHKAFFKEKIEPIFRNHCSGCHGNQSEKGGLRLDLKKTAFLGGDSGPVIVPGKPKESEVLVRLRLPMDDDEVMPPRKKERVPEAAISDLEKWIAMGAPWPESKSKMEKGGENHFTRFHSGLSSVQKADLAWLQRNKVYVEPLIWEGGGVRIVMAHADKVNGTMTDRFDSMRDQVKWLDLSRSELANDVQVAIGRCEELQILHLENSNVTDAAIRRIGVLPNLDYLNLHSTAVTDALVDHLAKMKTLRVVYVWNTKMTKQGMDRLRELLPHTKVVGGF